MARPLKIAIDFDGTIVEHKFPEIGNPVPGALKWMHVWQDAGAELILWTMRSLLTLTEAVEYCKYNGITFAGVNEGPNDRLWTTSPKVYAHVYVDDAACGCPCVTPINGRPYVDWAVVGPAVMDMIKARG